MAIDLSGIAEWLHGWFPYHTEVVAKNQTSANASKNLVTDISGKVTTENKVSVGSNSGLSMSNANVLSHSNSVTGGELTTTTLKKIKYDGQGHITETTNPNTSDLPNSETYANLGSNLTNQKLINDAINTKIGALSGIEFIVITTNKGTASADTMNKLYVVSENSKVNYYYTKRSGTSPNYTYSWEELDANIVADVSWNSVTGKPSTFTPSTHSHGNISDGGEITDITSDIEYAPIGVLGVDPFSDLIVAYNKFPIKFFVDRYAHSNIGSSANATQEAINTAIDTALGNKLSATKVTSWSSTTSNSNVPSEKLVKDSLDDLEDTIAGFDASNIDYDPASQTWGDYTQVVSTVANGLDWLKEITNGLNASVIGKQDEITSIRLVPQATDSSGKIIFYTGDEPT